MSKNKLKFMYYLSDINDIMAKSKTINRNVSTKRKSKTNFNVVHFLLHLLNTVKIYHWKTLSYPTHKATDELYDELNELIDNFVEILLGKNNRLILNIKPIKIVSQSDKQLLRYVEECKKKLNNLLTLSTIINESDTDLLNIRDEILGSLNKFTYLLTLK